MPTRPVPVSMSGSGERRTGYEQPLEHFPLPHHPCRWWRLALRPPSPPAGSREPQSRQSAEGHESLKDVCRRVQSEHRRPPAARSQGSPQRSNQSQKCNTEN